VQWGYTARGGNLTFTRDGSAISYSGIYFSLPDVGNPNRKLRVTIDTLTDINLSDEFEEVA